MSAGADDRVTLWRCPECESEWVDRPPRHHDKDHYDAVQCIGVPTSRELVERGMTGEYAALIELVQRAERDGDRLRLHLYSDGQWSVGHFCMAGRWEDSFGPLDSACRAVLDALDGKGGAVSNVIRLGDRVTVRGHRTPGVVVELRQRPDWVIVEFPDVPSPVAARYCDVRRVEDENTTTQRPEAA